MTLDTLSRSLANTLGVTDQTVLRWCRDGLLPDQPQRPGSGSHRTFTDRDVQVAAGLAVVCRGLHTCPGTGSLRARIGEAVRDAVLRGDGAAHIELTPGFTVTVDWAARQEATA